MIFFPNSRWALAGMVAVAFAVASGSLGAPSSAEAFRSLQMGIHEPSTFGENAELWPRMRGTNARVARGNVYWTTVTKASSPDGFDARNPADPQYDWSQVDAFVRESMSRGMHPLLTVLQAPAWAQGSGKRGGGPGSWKPDPGHVADFGQALATRYSGRFSDPANPVRRLPRVRYYQLWNEQNFNYYLSPQGDGRRRTGAITYVHMLNAFYSRVKRVHRSNVVITGGLGPFGKNNRERATNTDDDADPQAFMRDVLCLKGRGRTLRRKRPCGHPRARFDAWAQHPYSLAGTPTSKAISRDGAAIGNMPEISRTLRLAVKLRTVSPVKRKRLWVTEFAWFANPPHTQYGKSPVTHARYLSESVHRLWRAGVDTFVWYQLRDGTPHWPGGLYRGGNTVADDKARPALRAFRFPFFAWRSGRRIGVWALAHRGGRTKIRIERRSGGKWRKVQDVRSDSQGMIMRRLRTRRSGLYRARARSGKRKGAISYHFRVKKQREKRSAKTPEEVVT